MNSGYLYCAIDHIPHTSQSLRSLQDSMQAMVNLQQTRLRCSRKELGVLIQSVYYDTQTRVGGGGVFVSCLPMSPSTSVPSFTSPAVLSAGCYLRLHVLSSPFPEVENDSSVGIWRGNDVGGCAAEHNLASVHRFVSVSLLLKK